MAQTEHPLSLVTGGAGFIGSHIVERLLGEGQRVRVLDDFSTGKRENLPDHERLEVIEGDVGDYACVKEAMAGVGWVFHQAAIASVPKTVDDPLGSQRTNYLGTLNALEAARQCGVKRVMFAASAAVYGDLPGLPKRETSAIRPLSPYAVDKLASEHACQVYHRLHGLGTVCLRYFNVYGPRQDPSSPYSGVISIFTDRLHKGRRPVIYGDGKQSRDFIYIADVVEANLRAAVSDRAPGEALNIATGRSVTLNRLLETLCGLLDRPFEADYQSERAGDIHDSAAAIDKAQDTLDWRPRFDLEQGLRGLLGFEKA
jgi:UDP-glucose 4-epimerase